MRINDEEILSVAYDEDLEAELADARYARALKRISVSDVLSEVDHLIAEEYDERKHPLYAMAVQVLRHGGYPSTGRRSRLAEVVSAKFEDLLDIAVDRLVNEELSSGVSWGD
jgi:hypothetical protein